MTTRSTRSRVKELPKKPESTLPAPELTSPSVEQALMLKDPSRKCKYLDEQRLSASLKRLPKKDIELLRLKQDKLRDRDAQVPTFIRDRLQSGKATDGHLAKAAAATLVFAWEAAGTAVCISPQGLLLTCSHCVAETEGDYDPKKERWLLFASGEAVRAVPVAWDSQRDLALLQVIAASNACSPTFPFMEVSDTAPKGKAALLCIGHPGSEDFEADTSGVETGYDVLHVSEGRFRGMAPGQDPQDNSEIGALMHDCWTYWGHSGAPLVEKTKGKLVGLHSSWDDETGMRRGVAWAAIMTFLHEHSLLGNTMG